jgi:hypothetical protein
MSVNERFDRKKYMGLWRCFSETMARIISRFPRMVTKYMVKKMLKIRDCRAGSSDTPSRKNCVITVLFALPYF